ncbi:FimV/HubP family polar landmark protein [Psychrobacter nivimaris]|uniref:FimV/HubP family polar landmark protein n=1 Tax=Psychrobacter nivimaris TaxID=281738 RepID=UPI0037357540
MDNMLYIIAGLVLILLVAGFLLRKNKAQKSSAQLPTNSERNTITPTSKVDYGAPTQNIAIDENKFDHVTIAQRFVDQQRYDKAIETLKRGLSDKPNDGALSLKLLSIYATIDQPKDFNNVYESIKTHNDSKTIAQADEIRNLSFDELEPAAVQTLATDNANNDFGGIDFDLPISQTDNIDASSHQSIEEEEENNDIAISEPIDSLEVSDEVNNISPTTETSNDSFDLTLSDLENDFDAPNTTNETPVIPLDNVNDNVLETSANDNISNNEDDELSDFEFDFDSFDDTSNESTIDTNLSHNDNEKAVLEEDDFILDFDDLSADVDEDIAVTSDEDSNTEEHSIDTIQNSEDDFALSLDNLDTLDNIDTTLSDELPTTETNSDDIDNFIFEDIDFEDNASENTTLKENSFADINLEEPLLNDDIEVNDVEESNVAPTASLRFDDNTLMDDDFNIDDADSLFDAPSATTPVSTAAPVKSDTSITPQEAESAEDFSSRFAADFDFVKSLDSNQVTLDLADQYLQLGEYDSAKRLLNEVIAQGNSEQKQQAQLLLERTA